MKEPTKELMKAAGALEAAFKEFVRECATVAENNAEILSMVFTMTNTLNADFIERASKKGGAK